MRPSTDPSQFFAKRQSARRMQQVRVVVEEARVLAIEAHLAQAVGVLAADRQALGEVVGEIERRDVALLDELDRRVLQVT